MLLPLLGATKRRISIVSDKLKAYKPLYTNYEGKPLGTSYFFIFCCIIFFLFVKLTQAYNIIKIG